MIAEAIGISDMAMQKSGTQRVREMRGTAADDTKKKRPSIGRPRKECRHDEETVIKKHSRRLFALPLRSKGPLQYPARALAAVSYMMQ